MDLASAVKLGSEGGKKRVRLSRIVMEKLVERYNEMI